jgi:hypothetical protein
MTTDRVYPGYLSGRGTLAFFDRLSQQDGNQWSLHGSDSYGASCQFAGGAYHVSQQGNSHFAACSTQGIFGNFTFEGQLTITQGDCGGVTFREDNNGHFYYFLFCENGTYQVFKYVSYGASDAMILRSSRSFAIHTGLGRQNKIAVVANGDTMLFYANERQIDRVQDASYTLGSIALIARPLYGHTTDVIYSNARLWTL